MTKYNSVIKYILIAIFSITLLNCGGSSNGGIIGENDNGNGNGNDDGSNGNDDTNNRYKFQNGVVEGVDFETNTRKTGTISSENGFTYDEGDERIAFKIKNLIIGEFNLNNLNADKILLVSDIVGVERSDTTNKNVLKILRVLHSLDNDNDPLNGILIDDATKSKLVDLSEGKTKITENTIVELKALMVKAGKELVVEKKARDYYKKYVLTPLGITPKFNPFTLEVDIKSDDLTFTFKMTKDTTDSKYESSYDYTVDWGDGSTIETGITADKTHTYAGSGTYIIKVSGKFSDLSLGKGLDNKEKMKVTQILAWGDIAWKSFESGFTNSKDIGFHTTDTPDLSEVTNMANVFASSEISDIDFINDWDVSNIINMNAVFFAAKNFNGNISNWNVSNVINMHSMFSSATSFNRDLSEWNVSKVTSMNSMFLSATNFNQDISDWNVSSTIDMSNMFFSARNFNQDISDWDVANVTNMDYMFLSAKNFNQDLSGWNVAKITTKPKSFATGWDASKLPNFPTQ